MNWVNKAKKRMCLTYNERLSICRNRSNCGFKIMRRYRKLNLNKTFRVKVRVDIQ